MHEIVPMSKLDLVHKRLGQRGVDMIRFMASKDCYRKRGFKVYETVFVNAKCVNALDVAAMTGRVPQSAAAGPTIPLPTHLQQTLLKAAETGDLHLVQELLRQGANPNAEEFSNSRRRVLRESSDSSKKPRRAEDARRSARIFNTKLINYNLTEYTLIESFQMDEEIRDYYIPKDYEDAISCPDAPHWIAAMEEELEGLGTPIAS